MCFKSCLKWHPPSLFFGIFMLPEPVYFWSCCFYVQMYLTLETWTNIPFKIKLQHQRCSLVMTAVVSLIWSPAFAGYTWLLREMEVKLLCVRGMCLFQVKVLSSLFIIAHLPKVFSLITFVWLCTGARKELGCQQKLLGSTDPPGHSWAVVLSLLNTVVAVKYTAWNLCTTSCAVCFGPFFSSFFLN